MKYFRVILFFFFFNDTATTEIYTLSLHDALPISVRGDHAGGDAAARQHRAGAGRAGADPRAGDGVQPGQPQPVLPRSEEHTSELQSRQYLVCRLLLEKKKKINSIVDDTNN